MSLKWFTNDAMIAPWRIDSEEERRLALKADRDEAAKQSYADYYRDKAPDYYARGLEMINQVINKFRPNVQMIEREQYIIDMVYSLHRFGCMFDEYFLMDFEKLNTKGRDSFVTDKNRWDYYNKLNTPGGRAIFNDKFKTYQLFKEYYKRELLRISDEKDFPLFTEFRKKHQTFIVKPILGSGGRGVYIERESDDEDSVVFERILKCGTVLIEQLIKQAKEMEVLHPCSLNTMRIPTIRTSKGVTIFHPFLRIGVGNSEVDNAASGGIFALVDPDSGIVTQYGITENGDQYLKHPDSGIIIPGFVIPKWKEAVSFVGQLSQVVPENHYVGWDCALTEKEWIMVEGNAQGQFVTQYATKQGIRYELEELLKEI